MNAWYVALVLHVLGAAVWTGGHLVLALTVLPRALRSRRVEVITEFEAGFERIGIPALGVQIATGLWLAARYVPPGAWFDLGSPLSRVVLAKLSLLAATAALAAHARLRVLPGLTSERLGALAAHIVPVTVLSVLFVLVGLSLRVGGL